MKFNDVLVSKKDRFSIGVEEESQRNYVSIPVSNPFIDYEEYYEIDKETFKQYRADMKLALNFVQQCRDRLMDNRLMVKPGKYRGTPL